MTAPTSSSKWSLKRIIFKQPKNNGNNHKPFSPLLNSHHHDPSSPIEPAADDFPLFEFPSAEFSSTPVKHSHRHQLLPSKATVGTASTAVSTVMSSSPFTPSSNSGSGGNGCGAVNKTIGTNDEFSYSCANSTAWTSTPPSCSVKHVHLVVGGIGAVGGNGCENHQGGAVGMMAWKGKSGRREGSSKEMVEENTKEEKDGFVELITERQRSRRYSVPESALTRSDDNINSKSTFKNTLDSSKTEQGYFAQGYNLLGFHHHQQQQQQQHQDDNLFQHSTSISPRASASLEKEGYSQQTGYSQANRTASTVSKTNAMTSTAATSAAAIIIESKKSESPEEPPSTKRKSVNPEFFMEDAVVPPSPSNKQRQRQHQQQQQQQQQQKQLHQPQPQQPNNHEDYDNPNHLYAEINVKHRPLPVSRQGSEGTASLAMTSISSITGHGSLFNKDYDDNSGGILLPLPEGLWRIGSMVINTAAAAEENYFDYSNDETLRNHRGDGNNNGSNSGMFERIGNAAYQFFYTTCQCFEVNGGSVPMSPDVVKEEMSRATTTAAATTSALNDATVDGTNHAVNTMTSNASKGGSGGEQQPVFSSPMEN
ncbi:hypothetical protein ACHAWO_011528 [Cyclotella atomus]|uniref:Uncharacterized protein n=1 Tax=Cyclotella atomus TaxID=382360 RepID=A0ABD3MRF9_9STRA